MQNLVIRSSTMYKTLPQWTNSAHILLFTIPFCYIFPKDCSQVRGSESTVFYEKCFRFRLLKKSNASEFASSFFLQVRFQLLSSKCFRFHKNLTASTAFSYRFHIPGSTSISEH